MAKRTIGTVLVGFGTSARIFHAPLIHDNHCFELRGFVERNSTKGEQAWPGTQTWPSLDAALADPGNELFVICTPNPTHHPFALQCIQAGRHVVVEKPFTVTAAEAEELRAEAAAHGTVLTVFHNRRLDGDFMTLARLIDQGRLGRVVEAHMSFDRWAPAIRSKAWKEDGSLGNSLLEDLGSHLVDQALRLFGPPSSIWCRMDCQRDLSQVDDSFGISMKCGDVRVELSATMLAREARPRFLVYGTKGSFIKTGLDPQELQLGSGMSPRAEAFGKDNPANHARLLTMNEQGKDESYTVETLPGDYPQFYRNLHNAICNGLPPLVTPEEAIQVMQVLEEARHSTRKA